MSQLSKVAVITGGASGLGYACAGLFSATHHVVIGDLRNAEQAAQGLSSPATGVTVDVTSAEDCQHLADVAKGLGEIDVLIHCAGVVEQPNMHIADLDPARWRRSIDVNLTGTFLITHAFAPVLADHASVVLIASRTGRTGSSALHLGEPTRAEYSTGKAAVISYVKSLAWELAPRKIRVNGVAPGPINIGLSTPGREKVVKDFIPLGRMGTAADVTAGIQFLCSEGASWITGHVLDINGGMTM